jgi:hypothetical protein
MSDSFSILARFLERFDDDVEGRSLEEPPEDVRQKLLRFAGGTLPERERTELIQLLEAHPQWIPMLAREVKARRQPARPAS